VPTLYLDEPFGSGDAAHLVRDGAPFGLRAEMASLHNPGADDPYQLRFAAQMQWILVTKDRDYEKLHYLWCVFRHWRPQQPEHHAGILWTPGNLPNAVLVKCILDFFRLHAGQPLAARMWTLGNGGRTWTQNPAFR
jgi:hypothetical protein